MPFPIYSEESSCLKDSVLTSFSRNKEDELAGLLAASGGGLLPMCPEHHVASLRVLMKLHAQCLAVWLSFLTNWLTLFSFFPPDLLQLGVGHSCRPAAFGFALDPWQSTGPEAQAALITM